MGKLYKVLGNHNNTTRLKLLAENREGNLHVFNRLGANVTADPVFLPNGWTGYYGRQYHDTLDQLTFMWNHPGQKTIGKYRCTVVMSVVRTVIPAHHEYLPDVSFSKDVFIHAAHRGPTVG